MKAQPDEVSRYRRRLPTRIIILVASLLTYPSITAALPFNPDTIAFTVLEARFVETGSNTACYNCADADPLNDFKAELIFTDLVPQPSLPGSAWNWNAGIDLTGTTTTDFSGIYLSIVAEIKVTQWILNAPPEELAEFPLPSVGYGTLTGQVFNVDGPEFLVKECCSGSIQNVMIMQAFFPPTPSVPGNFISLPMEVQVFGNAPYAPEIPEPATLALVAGGIVVGWRHRRCKSTRRCL
jgi:hypothetical protein